MPSPHTFSSAAFSNAGTSQSQSYHHHLNHSDQDRDQDQDHRYLPQQTQRTQQTHHPHPSWMQQQQSYRKQHRLSRSFPSSTNQLPAPRYHTGTRSDRPQAPVSSSLGNRLDVGTGTGIGTNTSTSTYFSRKIPSLLPRTSSLLPPSQPSAQFPPTGFDAITNESIIPYSSIDCEPPSYVIPSTTHSRSSSIALTAEGDADLNRWSASTTTSSRHSTQKYYATGSHARRLSVDASALLVPSSTFAKTQSSQRLPGDRRRSSSSETSWGAYSSGSRFPTYPPAGPTPADRLSTTFAPHQLDSSLGTEPSLRGNATRAPIGASRAFKGASEVEENQVWDAFSGPGRRGSAELGPQQLPYTGMSSDHNGEPSQMRGHSRNRSQTAAKESADTTGSLRGRERGNRPPSQKAMLSRALQKANTAVQLDNAQNFEGARHAYAEACDLLHQVLARTSTDEDRRKLEAIRRTYTSRIEELDQMAPIQPVSEGKALPARPESLGLRLNPSLQFDDDDDLEESGGLETAALNRILRDGSRSSPNYGGPGLPISRMQTLGEPSRSSSARMPEHYPLQSSFSRSPLRDRASDEQLIFQMPAEDASLPPPLSPRRPRSPKLDDQSSPDGLVRSDFSLAARRTSHSPRHIRDSSRESNSWLDPIDESGGSTASSIHSRPSSAIVRRKHIRAPSGATEAEFDAALDAAVEAAYDDGYEPMGISDSESYGLDDPVVAKALRKVELAKERVRQNEREAFEQANGIEQRKQSQAEQQPDGDVVHEDFYDDGSSDEEERMLEEMTHDYSVDEFAFNLASHQAAARNSSSSDLPESAWQATVVSTDTVPADVSTSPTHPGVATHFPGAGSPKAPPPSQALPELPVKKSFSATTSSPGPGQSVRSRRMSGQNPKQLKIETSKLSQFGDPGRRYSVAQAQSGAHGIEFETPDMTGPADVNDSVGRPYSPPEGISPTQPVPPTPPFGHSRSRDSEDFTGSHSGSPSFRPPLRKNFSSSSLRSMKNRNMSLSNLDDASDMSPGTPLSTSYGINSKYPAMPTLPTPLAAAFRDKFTSSSAGGLYLFDDSLHSPQSPGSPNSLQGDAPVPLEPCPTDYLLRPFWLMRCLYQTLAHPRGGYLSNKLFVPRDVWKVKGVKIRNVEDKVATCDYLTAALLKLARVDTCDADAVLEEMQYLEGILEQVQANLTRKLGTDVGVQNSSMLFRDASNSAEIEAAISVPRSASVSGKSSSFSWRRLRSKNSAAGLNNSFNAKGNGLESGKESPGPETLPMTDHPTSRPSKRDPGNAQFTGPNAHYMGSLARLFDAAQTIDQIARQVEDPGLRHADKTQVGLELCTRHAAEFFGFFICRFVLSDLSVLLDKFIKRGSEWVLA